MSFLPLVERELRRLSRRPVTYYSRSAAGGLALGVGLATLYAGLAGAISPGSAGHGLVVVLGVLGLFAVVLEGVLMTADALSGERREGTLGLLFLTGLRAHDIVLGKLIACVGRSFNTLLAMLPVPALGILVGGVALGEVVQLMLALLNTLFLTASFGLWVSAGGRSERRVMGKALAWAVCWCLVPPMAGEAWTRWIGGTTARDVGLLVSPLGAVMGILSRSTTLKPLEWLVLCAGPHVTGWILLALASRRLDRSWRDDQRLVAPLPSGAGFWRRHWHAWLREPRRPVGDLPPMRWLAARRESVRGFLASQMFALLAMVLLGAAFRFASEPFFLLLTIFMMHMLLGIKMDGMACRALLAEKQSGLLELLLLTPAAEHLVDDTLLAMKRRLVVPLGFLLFIDIALLVTGAVSMSEPWEVVGWSLTVFLLAATMLSASYFSVWIQIYSGLAANSSAQGSRRALMQILVTPALITVFLFGAMGAATGGRQLGPGFLVTMMFTFAALIVTSLLGLYARAVCQLRDHLPELAARHGEVPGGRRPAALRRLLPF
jgi:hypothetical protein